ncbi:MAG: ABC transporter permease subunit [Acidobacteriota bacterium]
MPIHDQGYRRYGGGRAPRGRAWAVIANAGIRTMLAKRAFLALLLVSWFPFFVRSVQIYAAANLPQAAFLAPTPEMFRQYLEQQEVFVFFITVYTGAGLIANDRRANALQIYLSKPLTRAEYVFGKLAILMAFLLLVTWLPAIVLLVVQILFAGNFQFFTSNLYLFPAITVFSFIQVVTVATAMLALSSLSNSSRYVGILYAALLFFSQALFGVLRFVAGNTSLSWISIPFDLNQVGDAIFRLPLRYDTPWAVSLAALVAVVALSGVVLERRVRGVEVVA